MKSHSILSSILFVFIIHTTYAQSNYQSIDDLKALHKYEEEHMKATNKYDEEHLKQVHKDEEEALKRRHKYEETHINMRKSI